MVLIPNYKEVPITVAGGVSEAIRSIPGRNLFAVFMNMELTHEDGMLMSRSGAKKFPYTAIVTVSIDPAKHKIPDKGGIVEPHSVGW
jgi:hypothetical protein